MNQDICCKVLSKGCFSVQNAPGHMLQGAKQRVFFRTKCTRTYVAKDTNKGCFSGQNATRHMVQKTQNKGCFQNKRCHIICHQRHGQAQKLMPQRTMTRDRKDTRSPEGAAHSTKGMLFGTKVTHQRELVKT